jgi:hypothetical protein
MLLIRIRETQLSADPDSKNQCCGSGSGMNNREHISESLETIFWVKIQKFFGVDTGSGMGKIWIRDPEWKKINTCENYQLRQLLYAQP